MKVKKKYELGLPLLISLTLLSLISPIELLAQEQNVTLSLRDKEIRIFIRQVEKQTPYTFVYRNFILDPTARVSITCSQTPLKDVLRQVLGPLDITFILDGNTIVLMKSEGNNQSNKAAHALEEKIHIQGTVCDVAAEPLIGATILVQGSEDSPVGTITNINGEFALEVPVESTLLISYVGYKSVKVAVKGKNKFNITLKEDDTLQLDEVVVVGYGTQKKASITASIVSINTKDLVQTPQANVSNMLVGRMPGLIAMQRSGAPGEDGSTLLVRGVSTFTNNTAPLVMIDGVERSNYNGIDPNEIETINILKDASATAIYGVRGANGVILITTKKGTIGKPRLSYSGNYAVQRPTALPHYLNSADYALLHNEAAKNDTYVSGGIYDPKFSDADIELYRNGSDPVFHPNMNWIDDFLNRTTYRTQHNFNISGGTDRVKYFISTGFYDQQGLYKHTSVDKDHDLNAHNTRYNFRSNFDFNVTLDFKVDFQLAGQVQKTSTPGVGNSNLWREISYANPLASPGMVDGKIVKLDGPFGNINPWATLFGNGYDIRNQNNLNTTFRADYDLSRILLKGLNIHGSVSYDSYYHNDKAFRKSILNYVAKKNSDDPYDILYIPMGEENVWSASSKYGKNRKTHMEFGINYNQTFGKHTTSAMLLYNQSKYYSPSLQFYVPNAYQGIVGRLTYDYYSRYLAEFNMGYNGTENFAKGRRFGFFPAVSAGWVVTEEPFFPKNDILVFMKLRTSYGVVGNDKIGGERFLYLPSSYGDAEDLAINQYHFGVSSSPQNSLMLIENKIGNPFLTWEKAKKFNLALEMNLFKNHLTTTAEVFKERRNNILANRNTQPMIIGANLPAYNMGEMENKGWELDVNYRNNIRDFKYWGRFNYSFARNKILFQDEVVKKFDYQMRTGRRFRQFYGLKSDGFYNSWEEVNALDRPISSWSGKKLQPGDIKYVDINKDGVIDEYDEVPIGYSPVPEVIYGLSFGADWKGFDCSALFQGASNVSIKYFGRSLWPFVNGYESAKEFVLERWTHERYDAGEPINFPRLSLSPNKDTDNNYRDSDFWIRDASYLRLKNVEIGYTFNIDLIKRMGLESVRLYLSGSNLFTWSNVIDLDPEAPSRAGNVEINTYPLQKIYNIGLNVSL